MTRRDTVEVLEPAFTPGFKYLHRIPASRGRRQRKTDSTKVKVTLRLTVIMTRYLLLFDSYSLVSVERPL
jgi:hypothetical protein